MAESLMHHHRLTERSNRALQPVSPASYGSSMEVLFQFLLPPLSHRISYANLSNGVMYSLERLAKLLIFNGGTVIVLLKWLSRVLVFSYV